MPDGDDRAYLRRAIELALDNVAAGDQPFGAVVVVDGEVVGEGVNGVERSGDPTDHAEVAAIRAACLALGRHELADATLYSSAQPCPMCHGAALLVGIRRTVYAAPGEMVASAGFELPEVGATAQAALRTVSGTGIEHVALPGADEPFRRWLDRGSEGTLHPADLHPMQPTTGGEDD
jgi:guanine deaminase